MNDSDKYFLKSPPPYKNYLRKVYAYHGEFDAGNIDGINLEDKKISNWRFVQMWVASFSSGLTFA